VLEALAQSGRVVAGHDRDRVRHEAPVCAAASRRRKAVRVCIVYEHSLFAHGIKRLLEPQKAFRIIGMIERPALAGRDLRRLRPDVVIVEGNGSMAVMESLEGVTALAISLRGDEATIISGLPIRVAAPEQLADAIRSAARKRRRRRRHGATR